MESHEPQFRGVWIPADVLHLFRERTVTAMDVFLLVQIDSLVQKEVGCYASNEYLGKMMGWTPRAVQLSVAKLKKLGLLKQVGYDGRHRYLETAWSRVPTRGAMDCAPNKSRGAKDCAQALKAKALSYTGGGLKEVNEMLIPNTNITTTPIKDFDKHTAKRLRNTLLTIRRASGPFSVNKWAKQIQLLRTIDDQDEQTISEVVTWFNDHANDQYTPRVYSAETFRKKFCQLQDAMTRERPAAPVGVFIEPETKEWARKWGKIWPKNTNKDDELITIQVTRNNYTAFDHELWHAILYYRAVAEELKRINGFQNSKDTLPVLMLERLRHDMESVETFTRKWIDNLHRLAHNWDAWTGKLANCGFKRDSLFFIKMGRGWFQAYSGNPKDFDKAMELITNAIGEEKRHG
jgi:hypothetical protein